MKPGRLAAGPTIRPATTRGALIIRPNDRPPRNPPLRPDAASIRHAGFHPFYQSNVAWMRFRPPLVLDPDRLGPQKLDRRDIALIVTARVVVPTQTEGTGR